MKINLAHLSIKTVLVSLVLIGCSSTQKTPTPASGLIVSSFANPHRQDYVMTGKKYAIATQGILSTKAATEILNKGGNLIDAFVAASFSISVERPHSTGIGGGGFLVFYKADTKETIVIDFRERAPHKAGRDMYLDKQGNYIDDLSTDGSLSVAVPGLVKGLWEIHRKYGKLKWSDVLAPSIKIADEGFFVYPDLERALAHRKDVLVKFPDSKKIFIKSDGSSYKVGDVLVQKDLASTLKAIAKNGEKEFYQGTTAKKIAQFVKKTGGIMTENDLRRYKTMARVPVESNFLKYKIISMPPPSSGGTHVIQFLKLLEKETWTPMEMNSAKAIHYQASAFQMAFADRAQYLGDPDFVKVPTAELISDAYLNQRKKEIVMDKARSANEVRHGSFEQKKESTETTHMSLLDKDGNAISSTQTINGWMGSGAVATGTGILLNNEMDDFSAKPGTPNLYGAIGSDANAIAPFKTPLSSMSPTIVLDETGRPIMSVGAPGGTRIISCTALTIFNHLYFKQSLENSVKNIRIHHQWQPDTLFIEQPGPAPKELEKLKAMGYKIELGGIPCRVMSAALDTNNSEFTAVADPRDIGTAAAE
ncbi:MAG: gamma-glutamyltransferase [Bdellovibrionaceae bacterium]|nr:gamma-glutamyltransferase [Pseudobdellovibrionaceae bacterium]